MEIKVFTNSDFGEVRIAVNKNKEVLFCLMDVCKALGLDNPSQVKTRLDSGNLHFVEVTTKGKIMAVRECWVATDHGMELSVTPMITGKGQQYFLNLFCGEKV